MFVQKLNKVCAALTVVLIALLMASQMALATNPPELVQLVADNSNPVKQESVRLLQPVGGGQDVEIDKGFGTWLNYFDFVGAWLYSIAVGICVLWFLAGGIMIMVSGSNSGLRQTGIDQMKWSMIGLIILTFSGTVLRTLNNLFFT